MFAKHVPKHKHIFMLANMNTSKHVVMFANYVRERSEIDVRKHGMLANMKPELALYEATYQTRSLEFSV